MSRNEDNKAAGDAGLAAWQSMWKGFFPWIGQAGEGAAPQHQASPLEEQYAELRDTWQESVRKWTEFAKGASAGELPGPDKLREMFAPGSWAGPGAGVVDAALQRVLEGPRYAVLWDLDRKMLELQKLGLERDKEVAAYQAVVQQAWGTAFKRFNEALATDPEARNLGWRGLADRWLATANETLIEVYRSDEFLKAQSRMLRAASDRHLKEREIAEAWSEAAHLPTRTEVDELQREVVELRRELRLLRRAQAAPAPAREGSAAPAKAPARKRSAKPSSSRTTKRKT